MTKLYDKLAINQGLVLDLDFVEATGTVVRDKSKYHNHGTFGAGAAAPTWVQLPSGVWVLSFDGTDDFIDAGANSVLDLTGSLTVEAWIKIADISARMFIVGKDVLGDRGYCYGLNLKKLYGQHSGGELSSGNTTLGTTLYYHVGFVFDEPNNTVTYYLDGQADGSDATAGALSSTTTNLNIGRRAYAGAQSWFQGNIGKVRIRNRIVSAAEMQQSYLATKWRYGL